MRSDPSSPLHNDAPVPWSMPIVWALLAHVVLMGALTWGVSWRKDATPASFEVEVWSPEAMRAAPKPEPAPKVEPKPEPKPEPEPKRDCELQV